MDTGGALQVPSGPVPFEASGTPGTSGPVAAVLQHLVHVEITLPDSYPGNVTLSGRLSVAPAAGGALAAAVTMTDGSNSAPGSLALPAVPNSGTTFWCLQVCVSAALDPSSRVVGQVSMKTSTTAAPAADAGNIILMQHQVKASDSVPWSAGVAAASSLGTGPTLNDLA